MVYTDSSLYGAEGEPVDDNVLKDMANHNKAYSQAGSLLVLMDKKDLSRTAPVTLSVLDWMSRSSTRVFHSTFPAETQAALESI